MLIYYNKKEDRYTIKAVTKNSKKSIYTNSFKYNLHEVLNEILEYIINN